jgi:DNA replication protein DnaC
MDRLDSLLASVVERLPSGEPPEPRKPSPDEIAVMRKRRVELIQQQTDLLLARIGARYQAATLDSYQTPTNDQRVALGKMRNYAEKLSEEITAGHGILLFGSTGTGKDHLLIGLSKIAISKGFSLQWVNGVDLHAKMRDAIQRDESESNILKAYSTARVLVLSDPLPPSGVLTDYQAATLYRLVDVRYRNLLPVWCSLNVSDVDEARRRLGAATTDRLRDGSLAIECKWPSYRKARKILETNPNQ